MNAYIWICTLFGVLCSIAFVLLIAAMLYWHLWFWFCAYYNEAKVVFWVRKHRNLPYPWFIWYRVPWLVFSSLWRDSWLWYPSDVTYASGPTYRFTTSVFRMGSIRFPEKPIDPVETDITKGI